MLKFYRLTADNINKGGEQMYTIRQLAELYNMSLSGMRAVLLYNGIQPAEVKPRGQKYKTRLYDNGVFGALGKLGYVKKQEG